MIALPDGPLVAWYGDDFTGAAATMEAMTFAGLPAAVFFEPPAPDMLARFPGLRGIGIAGSARAETPEWMRANLPAVFRGLAATGAQMLQYKICSTLDSAPEVGSIGVAMDIARDVLSTRFFPILPAAPLMGRYQAFGSLFATAPGGVFRLDRHPVMARHPVTPMTEADVVLHLSRQTDIPLQTLSLDLLHQGKGAGQLAEWRKQGLVGVTMDAVSMDDMARLGQMLWDMRGSEVMAVASQGLQYALIEHWRAQGLLPPPPPAQSMGPAGPIVVVSGSVSPVTGAQIEYAEAVGFAVTALDARRLVDNAEAEVAGAVSRAAPLIEAGRDVLFCTARGPDDPTVAEFSAWRAGQGRSPTVLNRLVGEGLGEIVLRLVRSTALRRAVISGGDTSGYAARRLGLFALTALAPTIPGAALGLAHSEDSDVDGIQLALKGGQMGTTDYFSWIKEGGGPR